MQILKEDVRKRILVAAEDLFYQKGFKDTTTRSIAREVGISVSNLYLYYDNKEDIFYGVTDGFYEYFIKGFKAFANHDRTSEIDMNISQVIQMVLKADHKKFVILTDKSQGTKYEGFKNQIISILSSHMKSQVKKDLIQDGVILNIFAKNLMEGIIEIVKNYKDDRWIAKSIDTLVMYHMNGMNYFM